MSFVWPLLRPVVKFRDIVQFQVRTRALSTENIEAFFETQNGCSAYIFVIRVVVFLYPAIVVNVIELSEVVA